MALLDPLMPGRGHPARGHPARGHPEKVRA
jgi:hypothetical protein